MLTNTQLVEKLVNVANNYNTVYMWGVFGSPVTESIIASKAKQYPSWYTASRQAAFRSLIGKNYFGFDCVCLIKGLLWGWNGDNTKTYGGASYATNGVPDIGADSMINVCKDVSTNFSNIQIGEAVWLSGHIGVYIGNGKAVECTPAWSNKVQITAVGNIGAISGLNTRTWTKHGKLPYITYTDTGTTTPTTPTTPSTSGEIKVGDVVTFTGGGVYVSASASSPTYTRSVESVCRVTQTYNGAHPYHLISNDGKGVYGWVNAASVKEASTTSQSKAPVVGDLVDFKGGKVYVSSSAASAAATKCASRCKVTAISANSAHPYHLISSDGKGVYGWVDASTV